jgi:hypothetical protein
LSTQTIISAYLQRDEHNLVIVDWGDYSIVPVINTTQVCIFYLVDKFESWNLNNKYNTNAYIKFWLQK